MLERRLDSASCRDGEVGLFATSASGMVGVAGSGVVFGASCALVYLGIEVVLLVLDDMMRPRIDDAILVTRGMQAVVVSFVEAERRCPPIRCLVVKKNGQYGGRSGGAQELLLETFPIRKQLTFGSGTLLGVGSR